MRNGKKTEAMLLTRELMEILFLMGYWVEHKNSKAFIIESQNETAWDALAVNDIVKGAINTHNLANVMSGKNTLQDVFTYEIRVIANEKIIIEIYNLQSYKDRIKFDAVL